MRLHCSCDLCVIGMTLGMNRLKYFLSHVFVLSQSFMAVRMSWVLVVLFMFYNTAILMQYIYRKIAIQIRLMYCYKQKVMESSSWIRSWWVSSLGTLLSSSSKLIHRSLCLFISLTLLYYCPSQCSHHCSISTSHQRRSQLRCLIKWRKAYFWLNMEWRSPFLHSR